MGPRAGILTFVFTPGAEPSGEAEIEERERRMDIEMATRFMVIIVHVVVYSCYNLDVWRTSLV